MRKGFSILLAFAWVLPGYADDIDSLQDLSQAEFFDLSGDLAGVLAYRGMQPGEPYGVIGFDVGVEFSGISVEHENVWQTASGDEVSTLSLARIAVNKGLPLGFDIGAFIADAPGTNLHLYGGQLRYAIFEGGVATPALGLRAAYTKLDGVDQLSAETRSLDVSVSKGLGPMTPYLGYGRVWSDFSPAAGTGLADVERDDNRIFAGLRFTLLALQFTIEADRTADATAYSAKLGFGF